MKYAVLVGDGMADYPLKELRGKTPLEKAKIPHCDFLAREGLVGRVKTIPEGMPPGTDIAHLSIFGYAPQKYYQGRGPLEALKLGIKLGKFDLAMRCNLVTVQKNRLVDYSAGHISTQEAQEIIRFLNKKLSYPGMHFYCGVSYRHILIARIKELKVRTFAPHDVLDRKLEECLPQGKDKEWLRDIMEKSHRLLEDHPLNKKRIKKGKNPANMIWLWGQGRKPTMPSFFKKYGLRGGVICAVDLIKGLGKCIGLKVINVPGATGYLDTNYQGKARCALRVLKNNDFVFVHVEAPDEAGHEGNVKLKIKAIEDFDRKVVGTILQGLKKYKDYKILVLSDHPTPLALRTHTRDPVPFVFYSSRERRIDKKAQALNFSEKEAKKSKLFIKQGYKLMDFFLEEVKQK